MDNPDHTDQNLADKSSRLARLAFIISIVMAISGCLIITNIIPKLPGVIFFLLLYCILPLLWAIGVILGAFALFDKNRTGNLAIISLAINALAILPIIFFWLLATMEGLPYICLEDFGACFGP